MNIFRTPCRLGPGLLTWALLLLATAHGVAAETATRVPLATGQHITPLGISGAVQQFLNPGLAGYPDFVAGEALRSQLSPDGTTLAILCAGQNSLFKTDGSVDNANSTQYIFLYDVAGSHQAAPRLLQVIQQKNAHIGLLFAPDGNTLYAAGGSDDVVYVYTRKAGTWVAATPIALNHGGKGIGIRVQPNTGGIGLSADGKTLVVANNYNDSISVIDTTAGTVRYEHDLRPFFAGNEGTSAGVGGTYPFAVAVKGNETAYVSSARDREIVAVDISRPAAGRLVTRIKVDGNPLGMVLDPAQARLYVAQDNADQVAVIDTSSNQVVGRIDARAPAGLLPGPRYTGVATFAVTLSPDGNTLYAVNAGANSVAVIPLQGPQAHTVTGLIPTAYEPHDISFSGDGAWMYLINGKSATGPNPGHLSGQTARLAGISYPAGNAAASLAAKASNQYQFQLERASLVSAPVPKSADLPVLTSMVAQNNSYASAPDANELAVMAFLRDHIKHVIYIVKENRTYDQVLGDLGNGANGDPSLTQFGRLVTPNFHRLASQFVTLDNFMDPGDGSMDGWSWVMQGRVTNTEAITQQINYAAVNRGLSYESEGANRNVPVNLATTAMRDAAAGGVGTTLYSDATASLPGGTDNVLAGTANHASADAPFGIQNGSIFNAVLQAGGSVRNYGFLVNNIGRIGTLAAPLSDPFSAGVIQVAALEPSLAALTDPFFRGYDQNYPDLWRYNEWKREFDRFVADGNLPSLSLVRLSHDHMGNFGTALAGVNTPEAQQADNDLAVGLLVQAVAHSPYAADTLLMVIEDDVQDGPDHVDSHRGPAYVIGPYVKQGALVSTRYNQVSVLRTIEDILGTQHINLNTAFQRPMTDVFDIKSSGRWTYSALASTVLKTTTLNLAQGESSVKFVPGPNIKPRHTAAYWDRVMAGFDFSQADQVPTAQFNQLLWAGLMGRKPYPVLHGRARADSDD
jgi:DNA-binding beta-propeller fold protein YncE